jgi:hypothetical protein
LTSAVIWQRVSTERECGAAAYRQYLEDYVKQGAKEEFLQKATAALAIGSTGFIEGLRKRLPAQAGEQSNAKQWRRLLSFDTVRQAIEAAKAEPWDSFVNRKGDPGRDLALYYARRYGGFTLHELGDRTECSTFAVSKAVSRIKDRLQSDRVLQQLLKRMDSVVKASGDAAAKR